MKTISKADKSAIDKAAETLREKKAAVESAVEKFNEFVHNAEDEIREAVTEYNAALEDAGSVADDIASRIRDYCDERSEKWQEGERGQSYQAWIDEFETFDRSEIEIDYPPDIEDPNMDHADELERLQESPE